MLRNISEWKWLLESGSLDGRLDSIYPGGAAGARERYLCALERFLRTYGEAQVCICSAPGRTEIGGNHTDHQHGRVLAAAVDLDVLVIAAPAEDNTATVLSEGFEQFSVKILRTGPDLAEQGTSQALVRGVAESLIDMGYCAGGFNAYITGNVLQGSGLSSSAAFEVAVGAAISCMYNDSRIAQTELAIAAQRSENLYFGKPCGLMDQMASAVGSLVQIDFMDPAAPKVQPVAIDLKAFPYDICIVDTGGSHADLTPDYAAVPAEMNAVAGFLGKDVLREVDAGFFNEQIPRLRQALGDRAVLRAIHFFRENECVSREAAALEEGDYPRFLELVRQSGASSWKYLQNVTAGHDPAEQNLCIALALSEQFLGDGGAARVHGGGFAGTIQAFVPRGRTEDYKKMIEAVFGRGSCYHLQVRPFGGIEVFPGEF